MFCTAHNLLAERTHMGCSLSQWIQKRCNVFFFFLWCCIWDISGILEYLLLSSHCLNVHLISFVCCSFLIILTSLNTRWILELSGRNWMGGYILTWNILRLALQFSEQLSRIYLICFSIEVEHDFEKNIETKVV